MHSTFWARTDSGSANNPALNLTGAAAVEITFVPSGASGDLILEQPAGGGIDPDTQIDIGGTTYDFTFELSGTMPTQKKDGSQQVPDQFEGEVVYIVTVVDYPSAGDVTRLAFMPNQTATQAEMDDFGNGAIDVQAVDTTPPPGAVCFAGGTYLLTPSGNVTVEELSVGDVVITLDHGPKPIVWISKSEHVWPGSAVSELPIHISRNSFGPGKPLRDLAVSPQHKILLPMAKRNKGDRPFEALAPAKGLTDLHGIRIMRGKRSVVYYHIMLESHEILISEGLETESFYPGKMAMAMLRPHQRKAIFAAFPKLQDDPENAYGVPARVSLTCNQTRTWVLTLHRQKLADCQAD